jgi:two-component system cell cycle sensor histidine kinase/response regulator CckA
LTDHGAGANMPVAVSTILAMAFAHAPDAQLLVDAEDRIIDANLRAEQLFGYSRAELLDTSIATLVPECSNRLAHRKDGATVPVEMVLSTMQTEVGPVSLAVVRDITTHRATDEALRQSEARYRAVVQDQAEFIVRWLPDGTRTLVNDAYVRYFGQPRESLIGTSFLPLITTEQQRAEFSRRVSTVTRENPMMLNTHRARRADGEERWQEWNDRALFDADGRVVEWQSVGRDVHERVMAEERLRDSQNLLAILVEHTPAAVAMFDTQMRYLVWSRRWLIDYGLGDRDLQGLSHYEVFPDVSEAWKAVHRRCLAGATESCEEDEFPRANGKLDFVRWVVQPWFKASNEVGGIVMFTEVITERIQAERALRRSEDERRKLEHHVRDTQKMEAIGRLAAGVAHDFNNLLIVILSYSDELRNEYQLPEDVRDMLGEINTAGVRASRLTAQLLAFSRKQVLRLSRVDLGELVAEISRMLDRVLGEDVVLSIARAPGLWPVEVDAGQIEQVIVNLAVNSRDAMPDGGTLTIECSNVDATDDPPSDAPQLLPGHWVRLSVTDNGVGMDRATQEHIFEPFFTTKEQGKGTGLGLATVYGIVQQSGGIIALDSKLGEGTRFSLYFPAVETATTTHERAIGLAAAPRGTETLLVVEDELAVRQLFTTVLRRLGYTVYEANSGLQAIGLFTQHASSIQMIVTDVIMPGMSGAELAQQVRALRPAVRILFVSGYTDDTVVRRGVLHGEEDFLQKPFTPMELAQRVRAALDR